MAVYSASGNKAGVNTANTPMWQLRPGSSGRVLLRAWGVSVGTAPTTAPRFALIRSSALGTVSTTIAGVTHALAAAAAGAGVDAAWSVNPTFATSGPNIRTIDLPVTAGALFFERFPTPIELPIAGSAIGLVLFNINASGATAGSFDFNFEWEE